MFWNDRSVRLTRSPVSVCFIQRFLDCVGEETGGSKRSLLDPRFLIDSKLTFNNADQRNRGSRYNSPDQNDRFVRLTRSPVSVYFIQRFLDCVGEETGDQTIAFRSPVSYRFKATIQQRRPDQNDRSVRLTRSPVSVYFIQRFLDCVGEETGDLDATPQIKCPNRSQMDLLMQFLTLGLAVSGNRVR
jgi:hypothetical protein